MKTISQNKKLTEDRVCQILGYVLLFLVTLGSTMAVTQSYEFFMHNTLHPWYFYVFSAFSSVAALSYILHRLIGNVYVYLKYGELKPWSLFLEVEENKTSVVLKEKDVPSLGSTLLVLEEVNMIDDKRRFIYSGDNISDISCRVAFDLSEHLRLQDQEEIEITNKNKSFLIKRGLGIVYCIEKDLIPNKAVSKECIIDKLGYKEYLSSEEI